MEDLNNLVFPVIPNQYLVLINLYHTLDIQ